jgi:hypothetical protein
VLEITLLAWLSVFFFKRLGREPSWRRDEERRGGASEVLVGAGDAFGIECGTVTRGEFGVVG